MPIMLACSRHLSVRHLWAAAVLRLPEKAPLHRAARHAGTDTCAETERGVNHADGSQQVPA